jgi:hypothetical protein
MDFEIVDLNVTSAATDQLWISMVSRLGAVHGVPLQEGKGVAIKELAGRVETFRSHIAGAVPGPDFAVETGQLLSTVVFGVTEIRALFQRTRGAAADQGRPVLLRVMAAPPATAALPWELLLDPEGGAHRYLTLAPDAHIVRLARVRTYPVRLAAVPPPLRMLLVLSSPLASPDATTDLVFDCYEEKRALLQELTPLIERGLLEVETEDRPTIENLRRCIARRQRGYHIIHYIGHAVPQGLYLEDSRGWASLTHPDDFNALLRGCPDLRLVFFAGCQTAQSPADDAARPWPGPLSLADYCVRDACQVVVGMQAVLPFRTERMFSRFFYQGLTSGRTIADALTLARGGIFDDEYCGRGLLDWSVPCLFVGAEFPGRLVDTQAQPTPVKRRHREQLKLDVVEGDREFFSRHGQLRVVIDFLTGRTKHRLLVVTGPTGVGKTRLIDRALDDVDESLVCVLWMELKRLLEQKDPVKGLCERVFEVLSRNGDPPRRYEKGWSGNDWWARLIEEIVYRPIAIVIDDFETINQPRARFLRQAVEQLIQRRTQARLVLIARERTPDLVGPTSGLHVHEISLQPIGWDEVWRWIRRNLPVLARFDAPALLPFFADLGPVLENWQQLANEVARAGDDVKLSELAGKISPRPIAPPIRPARKRPPKPRPAGLSVACAGPHTEGRQKEFAVAITRLAAECGVAGRVVSEGLESALDPSTAIATLLPFKSPFGKKGYTSDAELLGWLNKAQLRADIVLLDFGSPAPSKAWRVALRRVAARGVLLIAAGGNSREPVFPAWYPEVLAVGALNKESRIADYSYWDSKDKKPDLFAPGEVKGTSLENLLPGQDLRGTSFAALHAVFAAILIWASRRTLSASQVRAILEGAAVPLESAKASARGPRRLDLDAALKRVRQDLVRAALSNGPLPFPELVAACSLPATTTLKITQEMVGHGALQQFTDRGVELYEWTRKAGLKRGVSALK